MVKTKTKIEKQLNNKTSSQLVETIIASKKKENWLKVAGILSGTRRNSISMNLGEIDEIVKDGEGIIVPGKILSQGELNKKVRVVALKFSEKAREKLLKSKIQASTIAEEIKDNPEARGLRVLTPTEER